MTSPAHIPDWFDVLWESHQHKLPFLLRNDAGKKLAREILGMAIQGVVTYSKTPRGVRALIAFSRIQAIVKGVQGVCDSPDPSPEEVAAAVERLVQKVKP